MRKSQEKDGSVQYAHEIDDNVMPVIQYVIRKNPAGEDIYKRRVITKKRTIKERSEGYEEKRERIVSARAKNRNDKIEANIKKYENIYSRFASNYHGTLDTLIE